MIESLSRIVLGPLLLAQGLYVRRVTPRLPEPCGERCGTCGEGPALRLLIIGDSAAAGVGVAHQDDALAGQLVANLAADFRLSWQLLAQTGLDTPQLLRRLEGSGAQGFDAVLVSVGVNDVTGAIAADDWLVCLVRLVQRSQQQCQVTLLADAMVLDTAMLAADGFHPGAPAYRIWAEQAANSLRQRFAAPAAT